jgi:hypothetical protein
MALIPEGDPILERKALAYSLWGPMMIRNKAYFNYPDAGKFENDYLSQMTKH